MFITSFSSKPSFDYVCFFWLTVCLILQTCVSKTEQMLKIIRDVKFISDDFLLPRSMCVNTIHDPCSSYGATRNRSYAGCWCFCPTYKPTFYETQRQCVGNQLVRTRGGSCKYHFNNENPREELKILSLSTPRNIKAPPGKECIIDLLDGTGNKYLICNGNWESVSINVKLWEVFEVNSRWSTKLSLKLKADENGTALSRFNGQLIRLVMKCRQIGTSIPVEKSCLLFKIHGTVTCPLLIEKPIPQDTTLYLSTTLETSTSITSGVYRVPSSEALISASSKPAKRAHSTNKATERSSTRKSSNIKQDKLENETPRGTIAGVVGGVGGGLLLILMIIFLARHWIKIRIAGAVARSDDVDGHEMYTGPSVSTLQMERVRTLSRDSGKYTETWYEEVPDDKAEKDKQESLYQEISSPTPKTSDVNSELYDDLIAPESNGSMTTSQSHHVKPNLLQSSNPMLTGFLNPGYQGDPGHDVKRESGQSRHSEVNKKETDKGKTEHSSPKIDGEYVSMQTSKSHLTDDDKRYTTLLNPKILEHKDEDTNSNSATFSGMQTCTGFKACNDDSRRSDGKSYNDNIAYSNAEVSKDAQETSKQSFTVYTPLGEARKYDIPTIPVTSQPSENSQFTQYEQMEERPCEVDEAGYSVASDSFPATFSTKL